MTLSRIGVRGTAAIGSAGALFLLAPAAASGATSPAPARVAVPQGLGAAALPKMVFGPTSPGTRETVSFVLAEQHIRQLAARVEAGMPGGYLTVGRFAARYGQPRPRIVALQRYLARFGIPAAAEADGLDVTARGTAGQFDRALSVRQNQYLLARLPASDGQPARPAMQIHGTTEEPLLPAALARYVVSILGLTDYPAFGSNAVHRLPLAHGVRPGSVQSGSLEPASFAARYRLRPLMLRGALGQGQTIGIVSLASMRPSDAQYFWSRDLRLRTKHDRIRLENVDGGSGRVSDAAGSGETTLDVEQSGALAPDASIIVYQAPNTDAGFLDGYFAAASQDKAGTISASWGESETDIAATVAAGQESATYARSFDEAYLELAAQGQTSFTSSGDSGAYDAYGDIGSTNLSVDNPADSPWTTAAGGTTLPGSIRLSATVSATVAAERTWGQDWLWPYYSLFTNPATGNPYSSEDAFISGNVTGSGGGVSTAEPAPAYQRAVRGAQSFSAVPYLTPAGYATRKGIRLAESWTLWNTGIDAATPAPAVVTGHGTGRELPDLAANADPYTGYEEYFSGFPGAHLQLGWGGTSFVAPQLAGSGAVIDSYLGRRSGFWNPAMYRLASRPGSPFTPLDASGAGNDNLYYTGTAGHIYNVGSGLGTPDLTALARDLAKRQ
jgi:kumamolisin